MVDGDFLKGYELDFLIGIGLSLLAGFLIGAERESRGKAAGISTHCFVIAGSMIFTYLSAQVDPNSTSRIAAQLVTGIGFLGAGMILKSESDARITNLTTAAAIWFAASIGMAIGFKFYFIAIVAIAFAVLVPKIPHISKLKDVADRQRRIDALNAHLATQINFFILTITKETVQSIGKDKATILHKIFEVLTFKDLKRRVTLQATTQEHKALERLHDRPFWIWNVEEHKQEDIDTKGDCCFNHIIDLPQKDGLDKPLYDYEQIVFDLLVTHDGNKHIWIKKATGLGISEFMLRFMAWLCLKDNALSGSQMCIVTGPRIDLAIALIDRMKKLFTSSKGISPAAAFDTKETVVELNGVKIEAFPSHHLDAMRGLPNVSFILLDEADFFPPGQQQDARDVSERYIAKSNPYIVMVSTPNAPDGLFERIEKESEDTCLYKRLFLDYTYGIGKIYTAQEIEKAKQSPSFEREYNLKYLGKIGNVFHTKDIEAAIEKGRKYDPDASNQFYSFTSRSMGIDPAYGSSAFGVVVTQWVDNHIQILHAEEYHRPDYNEMLSLVYGLISKYQVDKVYIDGANPSFIRSLKLQIGEEVDYDKVIARYKSEGLGDNGGEYMKIVPVSFNKEHKAMLGHCKMILEQDPGKIAINPDKFDKLITSLRTAVDNDGVLDKEATSYNDIFDAFRLALKFYHFRDSSEYD